MGVIIRPPSWHQTTEVIATVKVRRGQEYFREAVLNNFDGRCGVTGISVRGLLIASHILPWSTHPDERLNVANGLCLSRIHDAAFDQGLITFSDNLELQLSSQLKSFLGEPVVDSIFGNHEGQMLKLPDDAVMPDPQFLAQHRKAIFKKAA